METIETRALRWLLSDDRGLSSETLCSVMLGIPCGRRWLQGAHWPHDGSDFGRCARLLAVIPEWRGRLTEMSAVCPQWAALVSEWSRIEAAYLAEIGCGDDRRPSSPTYEMIQSVLSRIATPTDVRATAGE